MASDAKGDAALMEIGAAIGTSRERERCLAWGRHCAEWDDWERHIESGEPVPTEEEGTLLIKCDVVGCDTSTPMDPATWEDGAPRGWMKVGARTVVAVSIGGEFHEIAMHGLTCPAHRIDEKETP